MSKKTNNKNNKFDFAKNIGGNVLIWILIIGLGLYLMRENIFPDMLDAANVNIDWFLTSCICWLSY